MGSIMLYTILRYGLSFDNDRRGARKVSILLAEVEMQGGMTYCDQLGQTISANR